MLLKINQIDHKLYFNIELQKKINLINIENIFMALYIKYIKTIKFYYYYLDIYPTEKI